MAGTTSTEEEATAADGPVDGLPVGVIDLTAERWRGAERLAPGAGLEPRVIDDDDLAARLAQELTAPLRLEDWPGPVEPRSVGGGWIHDEVIDDDRESFEALLAGQRCPGPEATATVAQELRFPVTPYRGLPLGRRRGAMPAADPPPPSEARPQPHRSIRSGRPLVIDLTSHWAGPLATALLAEAGAEVVKLDPSCRPDGFRARPVLYRHLNGAKQIVDLDLRLPADRERFERLVVDADLLVESFSRRVLPNLGYGPAALVGLNPRLGVVSIKAFPAAGPEADWLAYGPGVHAVSGLAMASGRPRPAPVAYPDLVAGVTAYGAACAVLGAGGGAVEVSLAGSIAPLVERAVGRAATEAQETPGHHHG